MSDETKTPSEIEQEKQAQGFRDNAEAQERIDAQKVSSAESEAEIQAEIRRFDLEQSDIARSNRREQELLCQMRKDAKAEKERKDDLEVKVVVTGSACLFFGPFGALAWPLTALYLKKTRGKGS